MQVEKSPTFSRRQGRLIVSDKTTLPEWRWSFTECPIKLRRLVQAFWQAVQRNTHRLPRQPHTPHSAEAIPALEPLQRLILADDVGRTLFGEYAKHRQSARGHEEIGWVLLGLRRGPEAIALATLPAGTMRDAATEHVLFDADVQAFASRLVRQEQRALRLIGVVHTHPGSLRHPSTADYHGDIAWVPQLYGGEGVFGIGTADAEAHGEGVAWQPTPHVECFGPLCYSWYALGEHDRHYRPLPMELTIGPDWGAPWRTVWDEIEQHAARLENLAQMFAKARFAIQQGITKPTLVLTLPLPGAEEKAIQVRMEGKSVRYWLLTPDGPMAAQFHEERVDVGVFAMLAELVA